MNRLSPSEFDAKFAGRINTNSMGCWFMDFRSIGNFDYPNWSSFSVEDRIGYLKHVLKAEISSVHYNGKNYPPAKYSTCWYIRKILRLRIFNLKAGDDEFVGVDVYLRMMGH